MTRKEEGTLIREKMMLAVTNYFIVHGYAPSIKEIGDAVGLGSVATVSHHIDILMKEGRLETDAKAGSPRAFRVKGMRVVFVNEESRKNSVEGMVEK